MTSSEWRRTVGIVATAEDQDIREKTVKRSTTHILTTHTGSLPRPPELTAALLKCDRGEGAGGELDTRIRSEMIDVVRHQVEAGVSVVNDGEAGKIGYSTYVKERLEGFGGESGPDAPNRDVVDFPEYVRSVTGSRTTTRPACTGPISYRARDAVRTDIANLQSGLAGVDAEDAFMSAASPGVISGFLENQYYSSHEAYIFALADAMKNEYDEIHRARVVLQLDCPDLTDIQYPSGENLEGFRRWVQLHIEAINHATRDIPGEQMRLHLCWGTTRDRISATWLWVTLSIWSSRHGQRRSRSRRPTRATRTSGSCSRASSSPPVRS
ncbi:MAG: hypothetical protein ACR2OE_07910 [Thermomicrobiales bacterium]